MQLQRVVISILRFMLQRRNLPLPFEAGEDEEGVDRLVKPTKDQGLYPFKVNEKGAVRL
jgi:hypothetical protein